MIAVTLLGITGPGSVRSQSLWGCTAAVLQILLSCHSLRGERFPRTQTKVRRPALLLSFTVTVNVTVTVTVTGTVTVTLIVTVYHAYSRLKLNYNSVLCCNNNSAM
jgi:hypothetical protein